MRMVNRLIEPTSGRIVVEGEDVTRADPVELRRRIGYVIQQVGLFPHMTIAENVATVPQLLGWPARARRRRASTRCWRWSASIPASSCDRYPRHLSGGQRQRVGVARALAADPPVHADGRAVRRRRSRSCAPACRPSCSASCGGCARP